MDTPHGKTGSFLLFVYGTLKQGGCRHGPLAGQVFRGQVCSRPLYALYDLGRYPGLLPAPEDGSVIQGELYEVDCELLSWLDRVEGAPSWFALAPVQLDGINQPVWAYFYQSDPGDRPRIPSGVWQNS